MHEGDKCGEAVFDVFPRQSTLFSAVGKTTPPNKDSNELYLFQTNITLSQVLEDEGFSANCGVIQTAVSLVEEPVKQGNLHITLLSCLSLCLADVLKVPKSVRKKQKNSYNIAIF